jgi:hypothetical protein
MPLKYIFGQDQLVADFVARSKRASGFAPRAGFTDRKLRAIGIAKTDSELIPGVVDNELIAGIVYFNHLPEAGTIEMSVEALPGQHWLTRSTLAVMFQYPFLDCGCQLLITGISARSVHILRMLAVLNFTHILIPRACGRDEDGVISTLTYEDWVAGKFCQKYGHHLLDVKIEKAA